MHLITARMPRRIALLSSAILCAAPLACITEGEHHQTPPPVETKVAAAPAPAPAAPPLPPAPPPLAAPVKVATVEGVTEYKLANGLRVLIYPDTSKPTMVVNMTYLVGSRNEVYGETGMAHLLEHLLFKGTDLHPDIPKVLNTLGGGFNGSTNFDRTNYFAVFSASPESLSTALDLEADRMIHSHIWKKDLWDEETKKGEMTVVRNEMEKDENDPINITQQRAFSIAYDWHNYGKSTIGARSDVENVNIEHLQAFYRRYYQPDNAVLMVAGKIDAAKTIAEVNEKFGRIPRPERKLEKEWTVEPTQDGERAVNVRRVGGTPFLTIGYHAPAGSNSDANALNLIGQILTSAPSGRLYKALVDSKLAARVSVDYSLTRDPGFYQINVELPKNGDLEKVRSAALAVIENFAKKPITSEELVRARGTLMKNYDLAAKQTEAFAIRVSNAIAIGDWRLFFIGRDNVEHMTLAQAEAAAEHYFKQSNRTIGEYIPTEKPDRAEIPAPGDVAAMVADYKGRAPIAEGEVFDPSPKNIESRTLRFTAKNGMKGALLAKKTKGASVGVSMILHFGDEKSLSNQESTPELLAQMVMRGTTTHTRQQIKDLFDQLKTQATVSGTADAVHANLNTDREHLADALTLLAEVLKSPSIPADELTTLRNEQITGLEENRSEPQSLAATALQLALDPYPKGHPLAAVSVDQQLAQIKSAKAEKLKAFHKAFYGANHAEVAVVGDFDAKEVQAQLEKLFGSWNSSKPYARLVDKMKEPKALDDVIQAPDKANAFFIAAEMIPIKDSDADYPAFAIANEILGGAQLKSRLADRIRQQEGISYGVGSNFQGNTRDPASIWLTYAIYAPENLGRLDAAFKEELARARDKGFTADELNFAKTVWLKGRQVGRSQDGALARHLADSLFDERTLAFDEQLESNVSALTLEQINAAFNKLLDPSKIAYFKAGDFNKAAKAAAAPAPAPAAPAAPAPAAPAPAPAAPAPAPAK